MLFTYTHAVADFLKKTQYHHKMHLVIVQELSFTSHAISHIYPGVISWEL